MGQNDRPEIPSFFTSPCARIDNIRFDHLVFVFSRLSSLELQEKGLGKDLSEKRVAVL